MTSLIRWAIAPTAIALLSACHHAPDNHANLPPLPLNPGEVRLSPESQQKIGLEVAPVTSQAIRSTLRATGKMALIPDQEAHVTVTVTGRMLKIFKRLGDRVHKGEALAVLDSPDLGQAESDFLQAEAQLRLKKDALDRQEGLFKRQFAAKKDLVQAQSDYTTASIEYERATNKLRLLGLGREAIDRLAQSRRLDATLTVYAAIAGTITSKTLTVGETIQGGSPIYTIDDMSRLWALADIHEQDLADVEPGAPVTLASIAYPGRTFTGRVASVSESLTADTHMAEARIDVSNVNGLLKPQMYVNAAIASAETQRCPTVPATSVVLDGKDHVLFVQTAADCFKRRVVQPGPEANGLMAIKAGVQPGERIVSKGALLVAAQAKGG